MAGGEFPTEIPRGTAEIRDFLKWRRQRRGIVRAHRVRGEVLPQVDPGAGVDLRAAFDSVTWAGHASVILRLDGRTVLFDPIWSKRAAHVIARLTPAAPEWNRIPEPDLVLISHNHYDHLDAPTLKRLRRKPTVFLVPKGMRRWFLRRGFRNVEEMDWWEVRGIGGLRATYVPSRHFSGRTLWDRDKTAWGGWVVEGRSHSAYHAGDTGYFDGFREIGRRFPRLDVACIPIGAYEPRWFMRPMHVDPEEAGQAFLELGARHLLPIHWGTFRLTDEAMDEPPARIRAFFQQKGLDPGRLWLGRLGETNRLGRDETVPR